MPARRAVQLTVHPDASLSALNSGKESERPTVAWTTPPRPARRSSPARARISSVAAARLGTGLPWYPTWVGAFEVANPSAPASIASRTMRRISSTSGSLASRSVASSPITQVRSAVWPMRAPTLIAVPRLSTASRYSGKVAKGHSSPSPALRAATVIPSTFSRVRTIVSRCSGRVGATEKPQLPITTVVTPCQGDMVSMRSHITCAS